MEGVSRTEKQLGRSEWDRLGRSEWDRLGRSEWDRLGRSEHVHYHHVRP